MNRCIIIGASPYSNPNVIRQTVSADDFVICADGGLSVALDSNIVPNMVIGDFDSLKKKSLLENVPVIVLPVEKDDTDSISCMKYGIEQGYQNFVLLGMTGGRIDHTYANLHLLKYLFRHGCQGMMKDEHTQIYYTEKNFLLSNQKGKTVSVLPFGCEEAEVTLSGFKYPAQHLKMNTVFPIGTSNIVLTDNGVVYVHRGGVVIIVNDIV